MPDTLRIALAQIDTHLGDVNANTACISAARAEAAGQGADLVVTPEFSIGGYPPENLVRKPAPIAKFRAAIADLGRDTADGGTGLVA